MNIIYYVYYSLYYHKYHLYVICNGCLFHSQWNFGLYILYNITYRATVKNCIVLYTRINANIFRSILIIILYCMIMIDILFRDNVYRKLLIYNILYYESIIIYYVYMMSLTRFKIKTNVKCTKFVYM